MGLPVPCLTWHGLATKVCKVQTQPPWSDRPCLTLSRGLRMVECLVSGMALNFSLPCRPVCMSVCSSWPWFMLHFSGVKRLPWTPLIGLRWPLPAAAQPDFLPDRNSKAGGSSLNQVWLTPFPVQTSALIPGIPAACPLHTSDMAADTRWPWD